MSLTDEQRIQFAREWFEVVRRSAVDGNQRIANHIEFIKEWRRLSEHFGLKSNDDWFDALRILLDGSEGSCNALPDWLINAYELIATRIQDRSRNERSIAYEAQIESMLRRLMHEHTGIVAMLAEISVIGSERYKRGISVTVEPLAKDGSKSSLPLRPNESYRLRIEADPSVHDEWLHVMVIQQTMDGSFVPIYPNVFDFNTAFVVPGAELLVPDPICDYELRTPCVVGEWQLRVIASPDTFDWTPDYIPGVTAYGTRGSSLRESISQEVNSKVHSLQVTKTQMEKYPATFSVADTLLTVTQEK